VEDFGALIDAHNCADAGLCSRQSHTALVMVSPEDVATVRDELKTLGHVRDCLSERGCQMLETVPTPRFDPPDDREPKPWPVVYVSSAPGRSAETGRRRRGWAGLIAQRWP
jgi:hypothetical protein